MRFDKCSHFLIENILPPPKVPLCPCAVSVPCTGCWAVVNDYSCLLLEFHVNANPLMCVLFCNCSTILGQSVLFPLCTRVLEVCVYVCVQLTPFFLLSALSHQNCSSFLLVLLNSNIPICSFRVSISLLPLPICSCMLSTFSIRALSILIIVKIAQLVLLKLFLEPATLLFTCNLWRLLYKYH